MRVSLSSRSSAEASRSAIDCSQWASSALKAPTVDECTAMTPNAPARPRIAAAAMLRRPCSRSAPPSRRRSLAHSHTTIGSAAPGAPPARRRGPGGGAPPPPAEPAGAGGQVLPILVGRDGRAGGEADALAARHDLDDRAPLDVERALE